MPEDSGVVEEITMQEQWLLIGAVGALMILTATYFVARRRKPTKKQAGKTSAKQKPRKLPKEAIGSGQARVEKIYANLKHAWLTRDDGTKIFLDLDLANASGLNDLRVGQVLQVSWGHSRYKPDRLDACRVST